MTSTRQSDDALAMISALFPQDEPVLQSHPLLPGVAVPRFGQCDRWDYHAHRRPANRQPSDWQTIFPTHEVWNLHARELLMVLLNPEHPAVLARGLHRAARHPCSVGYAIGIGYEIRRLAEWAGEQQVTASLSLWDADTARLFIEQQRDRVKPSTLTSRIALIKRLHQLGAYLTGGGLPLDPWPGRTAMQVAGLKRDPVSTENIDPEVWFALIRAAYTYVHEFAADILKAREQYRTLRRVAAPTFVGFEQRLTAFLADPDNRIPVHAADKPGYHPVAAGTVNMDLLCLILGFDHQHMVPAGKQLQRIQRIVREAVAAGQTVVGGLGGPYAEVTRADGGRGPWHEGMGPRELVAEAVQLRNAAYIVTAGLSMMRDSEVREIVRGSVVEHYGSPAVISRRRKGDANVPVERWWIAEPVAEAITVAEALSLHEELIFAGAGRAAVLGDDEQSGAGGFSSSLVVRSFIEHVNRATARTGLYVPQGRATPQQFRKTMAMLAARRPGGQIAVRHQLKHVAIRVMANRVTEGYWASDQAWEKLLDSALEQVRIEKLADLYADHVDGRTLGYGPAAGKLAAAFDAVHAEAERLRSTGKAKHGDARVELDLLRQAKISIRFGTLNHCTLDERNPVGAKCLESGLTLPAGHRGPVQNLCQPGRCANSLIRPEHLPVYEAERGGLLTLLENPRLSTPQRGALQRQVDEVTEVIARAEA